MFSLHLTRDEVLIVRLALGMLRDAAIGKAEYSAEAHIRGMMIRLTAAEHMDSDTVVI